MKTSLTSLGNKVIFLGAVAVMLSVTDPWYAQGLMEKSGVSLYRADRTLAVAILVAAAIAGGAAMLREIGKGRGKKGSGAERLIIVLASIVAVALVVFRVLDPPASVETVERMMTQPGNIFDFTTESIPIEVSRQWGQWLAIAGAAVLALGNVLRAAGDLMLSRGGETGAKSNEGGVPGMPGATPTA